MRASASCSGPGASTARSPSAKPSTAEIRASASRDPTRRRLPQIDQRARLLPPEGRGQGGDDERGRHPLPAQHEAGHEPDRGPPDGPGKEPDVLGDGHLGPGGEVEVDGDVGPPPAAPGVDEAGRQEGDSPVRTSTLPRPPRTTQLEPSTWSTSSKSVRTRSGAARGGSATPTRWTWASRSQKESGASGTGTGRVGAGPPPPPITAARSRPRCAGSRRGTTFPPPALRRAPRSGA